MGSVPGLMTITLGAGLDEQHGGCESCRYGISVRPAEQGQMRCADCGAPVTTVLLGRGASAEGADDLPQEIRVDLDLTQVA